MLGPYTHYLRFLYDQTGCYCNEGGESESETIDDMPNCELIPGWKDGSGDGCDWVRLPVVLCLCPVINADIHVTTLYCSTNFMMTQDVRIMAAFQERMDI